MSVGDVRALASAYGLPFAEVSAQTGEGVEAAFTELARETVRKLDEGVARISSAAAGGGQVAARPACALS